MQARRQDCRISSKPLVILVPKYRFVQIREGSWGGRLPFPDLRAHDPLRACRRLPMLFCRGTFRRQVLAGTTPATLSVSPHMELNRTYGTSRIACFIRRHTSSIAFRSDSRAAETALRANQLFEFLLDAFCPVLCCPVQYDQNFTKFCVYRL